MKTIASHLSKELREQYKRRSLPIRIGDEVKVMVGKNAGKTGKISKVDTKSKRIFITGVVDKRTVGTEVQIPINPSNVKILELNLEDEKRRKILLRKVKELKYENPKAEPKKEETKSEAKEVKHETEIKKKETEITEKHETEKTADTKVLESTEKAKNVGSKSKAGSPQKV